MCWHGKHLNDARSRGDQCSNEQVKQCDFFFNMSAQHCPDATISAAASLRFLGEAEPGGESPGLLSL